ncbi:MAG: hypothetical protein ACK58N_11530 [Synechocystis sp.]|jgi:hypothetical protein
MKIIDLEFQNFSDLLSRVTGGVVVSRSGRKIFDHKFFSNGKFGAFFAGFEAIAWGGKKAKSGGSVTGSIRKTANGVVSTASSASFALAE